MKSASNRVPFVGGARTTTGEETRCSWKGSGIHFQMESSRWTCARQVAQRLRCRDNYRPTTAQDSAGRMPIPMKVVSDSDLIPVTHSDAKPVTVGAKRRARCVSQTCHARAHGDDFATGIQTGQSHHCSTPGRPTKQIWAQRPENTATYILPAGERARRIRLGKALFGMGLIKA